MYTECPHCQSVFRLTVPVLRKAHGRVRCGSCAEVFDALDHLRDDDGKARPSGLAETSAGERFERQSRRLLATLDELAGPGEVRIEDTGVEWRVLDDDGAAAGAPAAADAGDSDSDAASSIRWYLDEPADGVGTARGAQQGAAQEALDLGDDAAGEMRYDDNTPLPEDDDAAPPTPAAPRRRADDRKPPPVSHEFQVDLALGDADDWRALLAEVSDADAPQQTGTADAARAADASPTAASEPGAAAAQRELDAALADAADDATRDTLEQSMNLQIDTDLMQALAAHDAAGKQDDGRYQRSSEALFETIVMEGDAVHDGADEDDVPAAAHARVSGPAPPAADSAAEPARPAWPAVAAGVALVLLLSAQLVHANRSTLATLEPVRTILVPVYRVFGRTLVPAWDVRGWQFEATNGSTDAAGRRLTIRSRITNRGDRALPYPLLHVSLTDRFEEVVGSRVLGPETYLTGNAAAARRVAPGSDFTAVIAVDAPPADAVGFKLDVCYRIADSRLRCAIDDFRD